MIGLREPGLVRCVVAVNAITDPIAMFGETLKYTREPTALHYWTTYLGDRYLDKAVATAISPARSAQFIRVPVLLLQDTQGTFVPASQSRHLKKQMDLYERSAQLREYEGGDVDFILPATRRFLLTQTDAFVAKHLGSNTAVE